MKKLLSIVILSLSTLVASAAINLVDFGTAVDNYHKTQMKSSWDFCGHYSELLKLAETEENFLVLFAEFLKHPKANSAVYNGKDNKALWKASIVFSIWIDKNLDKCPKLTLLQACRIASVEYGKAHPELLEEAKSAGYKVNGESLSISDIVYLNETCGGNEDFMLSLDIKDLPSYLFNRYVHKKTPVWLTGTDVKKAYDEVTYVSSYLLSKSLAGDQIAEKLVKKLQQIEDALYIKLTRSQKIQ